MGVLNNVTSLTTKDCGLNADSVTVLMMLRSCCRLGARTSTKWARATIHPSNSHFRNHSLATTSNPRLLAPPAIQYRSHSHGAMSHQDEDENPEAVEEMTRITMWGMYSNLGLSGIKAATGLYTGSAALIADAGHSLSDLFSDIVTLWTVKLARQPADSDHPYGYGKYETVGALAVSGVLVLTAVGLGQHSGLELMGTLDGPLWNPELTTITMGPLAIGGAAAGIGVKEWLYRVTLDAGKKHRSNVLIANAWHHRSDALSSIVAVAGIGGTLAGVPCLDPLGGIIVSGMIGKVAWDIGFDAVQELSDKATDEEFNASFRENALASGLEVLDVHDIRARRMGPYTLVDLHMVVHSRMSITAAGHAALRLRKHVSETMPEVNEVLVHIDTYPRKNWKKGGRKAAIDLPTHTEIEEEVRRVLQERVPEIVGVTRVMSHYEEGLVSVTTGVMVDDGISVHEAKQIAGKGRAALLTLPDVSHADVHLELFGDSDLACNRLLRRISNSFLDG